MRTSRRAIMQLLAAAALAAQGRVAGAAPDERQRLATCLRHPESAAAIGRAYLRTRPAERDPDRLLAAIRADIVRGDPVLAGRPLAAVPKARLRRALRKTAAGSLAAEDFVNVDGWILSRTEAQICALAACG